MSLITIDDDSSDEMAVDSDAGDTADAGTVTLNEKMYEESAGKEALPIKACMEEESSDSAGLETCDKPKDKPILELMKHLINYNGKQNTTTLTNAQLIGILKKEFNIDITNLHFLTVDIYMNVLKKFLKDWPQWDEFDRVMHESRCMNDSEEIEKMLESEYESLKAYLAAMLQACKPFAREAAQSAKRMIELPSTSHQPAVGDVVLEVHCTRNQLNSLFFRKPHPGFNHTIFNIDSPVPKRINVEELSFQTILNWSHIAVTVNINCFKYERELVHNFKHTLLNRKLQREAEEIELNRHLQMSKNTKAAPSVSKEDVKLVIQKIMHSVRYCRDVQRDIEVLYRTISSDIDVLPEEFNAQSVFRHYMSPYPYVRYLYEDVNTESDNYDLQLQEIISPRLKFSVIRMCLKTSAFNSDIGWLKLECTYCNLNFIGIEGIEQLKNHFKDVHQNEPDWMCMNCKETFTAKDLATKRWLHKCGHES